jgi:hypothetical protein
VKEADGVTLELLTLRLVTLDIRQARNAVPLKATMQRQPLRANKRETINWLKFTLEGGGERTHGYAFTDSAFAGCWI